MGTYFNEHERLFDFLGLDTYKYHQIFRSQEADSSGMAFNKRFERSSLKGAKSNVVWAGLHLTLAMNAMNASYYRSPPPPEKAQSGFAFGDKDLWALGAILAGVIDMGRNLITHLTAIYDIEGRTGLDKKLLKYFKWIVGTILFVTWIFRCPCHHFTE